MRIRPLAPADWAEWRRMRMALWPDVADVGTEADMRAWMDRPDTAVLVAERADGHSLCGFVELGTRPYAEGCLTSPVAFVEGWFVDADVRRRGHGRALLAAAEAWARAGGYVEIASDAEIDNTISLEAHRRAGFAEVVRLVAFRKSLTSSADTSP